MSAPLDIGARPARILVVDDERRNRMVLEVILEAEGYVVLHATSGEEALAAVAKERPDLILLDVMMPDMSGYQVTEALKARAEHKHIPVIIVTALADREARLRGLAAGAEDFLTKPIDRAELCIRVRNLLRVKAYADLLERYGEDLEREVQARTRQLAESEARYRRIVETGCEGVWVVDAQSKTIFVNARMAKMLGRDATAVIGTSPAEFLDEKGTTQFAEEMESLRAGRQTKQSEACFPRTGDGPLWALVEMTAIRDAAGTFDGALAMVMDITERKRTEQARQDAELLFRRLFEASIIGVFVAEGAVIREANDTFLGMIGYSRQELESGALEWESLTPVEWRRELGAVELELRTRGATAPREKEYIRKDGTRVPVLVGRAQVDGDRRLVVVTDLTSLKSAEKANKALEEQFRQSQKMEAVGRLAGGVAHDFNNLLSVVLSYSEMLMGDLPADDPVREDIEEIHHAGTRAADLTRQLLTFSRQQVVEPTILDLNEVLATMDKMLQRVVGEDVVLTSIPGASLGRVRADPGSIEQVIMNLVVNARDAMPTGGKLTMETSNVVLDADYAATHVGARAGAHVVLSVSDNGSGMDEATLAQIFEPFFTTKAKGAGTGLGLSTVFGITQQSGGSICVTSAPGRGTTFKIYLPREQAMPETIHPVRYSMVPRGPETILLVEDEEQVREVTRGILRRFGYEVLVAQGPADALLLCEQHEGKIHLLLSDVVMPGRSGPELAHRLVRARPDMKVLYMSGYTDDAPLRHGVIDPHFAYLQKPITVATLTRKVRDVLDRIVEEGA